MKNLVEKNENAHRSVSTLVWVLLSQVRRAAPACGAIQLWPRLSTTSLVATFKRRFFWARLRNFQKVKISEIYKRFSNRKKMVIETLFLSLSNFWHMVWSCAGKSKVRNWRKIIRWILRKLWNTITSWLKKNCELLPVLDCMYCPCWINA